MVQDGVERVREDIDPIAKAYSSPKFECILKKRCQFPQVFEPVLSRASALDIPSSAASFVPSFSGCVPSVFLFFSLYSRANATLLAQWLPVLRSQGPQAVHEWIHEELRGLPRVYDRAHEQMCYCPSILWMMPRGAANRLYRSLFRTSARKKQDGRGTQNIIVTQRSTWLAIRIFSLSPLCSYATVACFLFQNAYISYARQVQVRRGQTNQVCVRAYQIYMKGIIPLFLLPRRFVF